MVLNPSRSASANRFSTRFTARTSPPKPTSATKQTDDGMVQFSNEEIKEMQMARSIAGSSTFIPPVMFRKTS